MNKNRVVIQNTTGEVRVSSLVLAFGARIKVMRENLSLSLEELARRAKLPVTTVRELEANQLSDQHIHFLMLNQLGKALDCHPAELLGE